mmetsp:Transcript_9847/g.18914  ORF Transcript_9847/g.18914 Transcript_9847/m.18914 type:complete len:162 (-) Transcript_9847:110-595(-)
MRPRHLRLHPQNQRQLHRLVQRLQKTRTLLPVSSSPNRALIKTKCMLPPETWFADFLSSIIRTSYQIMAVDAGTPKAVVAARCYASFINKRLPGIPALLLAVNTNSVLDNDVAFIRGANLHRVAAESGCFQTDCCYFVDVEEKGGELHAVFEELVEDAAII